MMSAVLKLLPPLVLALTFLGASETNLDDIPKEVIFNGICPYLSYLDLVLVGLLSRAYWQALEQHIFQPVSGLPAGSAQYWPLELITQDLQRAKSEGAKRSLGCMHDRYLAFLESCSPLNPMDRVDFEWLMAAFKNIELVKEAGSLNFPAGKNDSPCWPHLGRLFLTCAGVKVHFLSDSIDSYDVGFVRDWVAPLGAIYFNVVILDIERISEKGLLPGLNLAEDIAEVENLRELFSRGIQEAEFPTVPGFMTLLMMMVLARDQDDLALIQSNYKAMEDYKKAAHRAVIWKAAKGEGIATIRAFIDDCEFDDGEKEQILTFAAAHDFYVEELAGCLLGDERMAHLKGRIAQIESNTALGLDCCKEELHQILFLKSKPTSDFEGALLNWIEESHLQPCLSTVLLAYIQGYSVGFVGRLGGMVVELDYSQLTCIVNTFIHSFPLPTASILLSCNYHLSGVLGKRTLFKSVAVGNDGDVGAIDEAELALAKSLFITPQTAGLNSFGEILTSLFPDRFLAALLKDRARLGDAQYLSFLAWDAWNRRLGETVGVLEASCGPDVLACVASIYAPYKSARLPCRDQTES